jgi:hypothetical protein
MISSWSATRAPPRRFWRVRAQPPALRCAPLRRPLLCPVSCAALALGAACLPARGLHVKPVSCQTI